MTDFKIALASTIAFVVVACGDPKTTTDAAKADARVDAAKEPPPYRCDLADCKDGVARTCNSNPQILECNVVAGACGPFVDGPSGKAINWCSCGDLAEGDGKCLDGRFGVACADGLAGLTDCGLGYVCAARPNGPFGIGCDCNNLPDGICPGISCSADPDCATCTPNCGGRTCGDNGCNGECGTCDTTSECVSGQCEPICVPNCIGKVCGSDGCGGSCGSCAGGAACNADGTCPGACVPTCSGKTCGDDGCGGSCGSCSDGLSCSVAGACDCPYYSALDYKLSLATATFPPQFSFLSVNLVHTGLDGSTKRDGARMGFVAPSVQTFTFRVPGCRPNLNMKLHYALSGKSCVADVVITDRTSVVLPPPIINADGSCTAPAL